MGYSALLDIVIYMCSGSLYELHAESNTSKCRKKTIVFFPLNIHYNLLKKKFIKRNEISRFMQIFWPISRVHFYSGPETNIN